LEDKNVTFDLSTVIFWTKLSGVSQGATGTGMALKPLDANDLATTVENLSLSVIEHFSADPQPQFGADA
jgi:hypothetical protein